MKRYYFEDFFPLVPIHHRVMICRDSKRVSKCFNFLCCVAWLWKPLFCSVLCSPGKRRAWPQKSMLQSRALLLWCFGPAWWKEGQMIGRWYLNLCRWCSRAWCCPGSFSLLSPTDPRKACFEKWGSCWVWGELTSGVALPLWSWSPFLKLFLSFPGVQA